MNPNRPEPPDNPGEGYRWVPGLADDAHPVTGAIRDCKCSARRHAERQRSNPCGQAAVARVAGQLRCGWHLRGDGMWVDAGVVMKWILEETGEETAV